jgi:hypothetical protein
MIELNRILFSVSAIVVLIWLSYFGCLLGAVFRLRRHAPAGERYEASFSEWVPVPHGELAKQYACQFPGSRALRTMRVLYAAMMYGIILFVFLDMLSWITR